MYNQSTELSFGNASQLIAQQNVHMNFMHIAKKLESIHQYCAKRSPQMPGRPFGVYDVPDLVYTNPLLVCWGTWLLRAESWELPWCIFLSLWYNVCWAMAFSCSILCAGWRTTSMYSHKVGVTLSRVTLREVLSTRQHWGFKFRIVSSGLHFVSAAMPADLVVKKGLKLGFKSWVHNCESGCENTFGSSQTWLVAIIMEALFYALLPPLALMCAHLRTCVCALSRSFALFCAHFRVSERCHPNGLQHGDRFTQGFAAHHVWYTLPIRTLQLFPTLYTQ